MICKLPADGQFWVVIPKYSNGDYHVGVELFASKDKAQKRADGMAPGCDPIVASFILMERMLVEDE